MAKQMLKLEGGVYHVSAPLFYKRPGWFLDRVQLNQAHLILYRNGRQAGRVVPMETKTEPSMADYNLELPQL
jgi:hypothetical protein